MSQTLNGLQFRDGFLAAARNLQLQKEMLNQLNVFPVADRDTGINMALTIKKTAEHLPDSGTPAQIMEQACFSLLEYSHGNSGTILALFFEGFTAELPQEPAVNGRQLAHAFQKGADCAWSGVAHPVAGTILSVASQSAEAGLSMTEITDDAGQIMKRITDEAHASLLLTPMQNPVLRASQIADSGALGFCLILDGFLEAFASEYPPLSYPPLKLPEAPASSDMPLTQRYCTEFVLSLHEDAEEVQLRQVLQPLGEFFLLVSQGQLCKVHIHTDVPQKVLSLASGFGTLKSKKIDDMAQQI
ncbi:MAG: DAK2 domain-containing protein [Anaerovoracaceae bacterium]|nr:DAK2 domain-containing protein [Anaerovoracaceae bacterium]